jgi:hypothetical protein
MKNGPSFYFCFHGSLTCGLRRRGEWSVHFLIDHKFGPNLGWKRLEMDVECAALRWALTSISAPKQTSMIHLSMLIGVTFNVA